MRKYRKNTWWPKIEAAILEADGDAVSFILLIMCDLLHNLKLHESQKLCINMIKIFQCDLLAFLYSIHAILCRIRDYKYIRNSQK